MRGPEQECEIQTDSLQGPNHTTSEALFFENSKWESSCQRFDEQGAALAALPRAIWSEHGSKRFEGCTRCTALLLRCMSPRRLCLDRACLAQLRGLGTRIGCGSEAERPRNDQKRRETKGSDGTARGPERPWLGRWTRHLSEGDLFTAPHLRIGCNAKSLHMRLVADWLSVAACALSSSSLPRRCRPPPQVARQLGSLFTPRK